MNLQVMHREPDLFADYRFGVQFIILWLGGLCVLAVRQILGMSAANTWDECSLVPIFQYGKLNFCSPDSAPIKQWKQ